MVATAGITIRVFVTFSDCKESNATKPSRQRMCGLNFSHAVIIEMRVRNKKLQSSNLVRLNRAQ